LIICSEEVSGSHDSSCSLSCRDGFITRRDKSSFVTKLCHPPVSDVGGEEDEKGSERGEE
jgi:hypothetical protein